MLVRAYDALDGFHARELSTVRAWPHRTGSGYVVDCFWTAWDAFAVADSYGTQSSARSAPGTTPTPPPPCAGASFGRSALPVEWLERLSGRAVAEPLVDRLEALA